MKGSSIMKKILATMLAIMLVLGLCACGGDNGGNPTTPPAQSNGTSDAPMGYAMKVNGISFGVGMDAQKVVEKLGACEPVITESCGDMGGDDYEYAYQDYIIYANNGGGAVRIYCVEIISDLVSTPENVIIGDSAEAVKTAYGDPTSETATSLIYEKDGMQLIFILENDSVTSIQYLEK